MEKCKNCGENIDLFIGETTKARRYIHVIKMGDVWCWTSKSIKHCTNPEPINNKRLD